jgi:NADH-quinone oxidoreductase subunit E
MTTTRQPTVFGDDIRAEARSLIERYPHQRSALLPLLHLVQSVEGYVTPAGVAFCAEMLGLTKAEVGAVATFYTMYKRRPTGDYLVSVCTNTLCGLLGGDEIFADLKAELGVGHDETTDDGTITLEHAECLAACDYAPVVTVNYEFFDKQSVESAREIVAALRRGERPTPSRGAPLCTFREIERQLAGLGDDRADAVASAAGGDETFAGLALAADRDEAAPAYPDGRAPASEGGD